MNQILAKRSVKKKLYKLAKKTYFDVNCLGIKKEI